MDGRRFNPRGSQRFTPQPEAVGDQLQGGECNIKVSNDVRRRLALYALATQQTMRMLAERSILEFLEREKRKVEREMAQANHTIP